MVETPTTTASSPSTVDGKHDLDLMSIRSMVGIKKQLNSIETYNYEYNQVKILLFQLAGGDIGPYEELL